VTKPGAGPARRPVRRHPAEQLGGETAGAHALPFDIRAAFEVHRPRDDIAARFGRLDGLVNYAAVPDEGGVGDTDPDRFDAAVSVDMTSMLPVTRAMLPLLHAGREASIVNTLSTQPFFGQPKIADHAAAKGGVTGLRRSMAVDLAPHGIRANGVAPGFIDTRMAVTADDAHGHADPAFRTVYLEGRRIPLGRPGTPDECAGALIFLLSTQAADITGQVLCVDGGLSATC
jgi:NAD(P)-dependent dehydrogenase (short-subunit alcohol dehydrogenase family)